jgi:hypothetical protein
VLLCHLIGRCIRDRKSYGEVATHPPLCCNEEDFEGFGIWKEEVQALQKVLKSHLYILDEAES